MLNYLLKVKLPPVISIALFCSVIFYSFNSKKPHKAYVDPIFEYIGRISKQLHLDKINLGYDSLQIRIWVNRSFSDSNQVVTIKYNKGSWLAYLYDIHSQHNRERNIDTIMSYSQRSLLPKTSWSNLLKLLKYEKIQELPDQMDIDHFEPRLMDGWMCIIEIADMKSYRFFTYNNPDFYSDWQSRNVINIINAVEKEFMIKFYGKGLF